MQTVSSNAPGAIMRLMSWAAVGMFRKANQIAANQKAYRRLELMDTRMLRDMGLTRDQVRYQAQLERDIFNLHREF